MNPLQLQFKDEVLSYLSLVNQSNFGTSYDGLITIIYHYKDKGLLKSEVVQVIQEIGKEGLNEHQDEVLMEISSCLHGYCPPSKDINW